MPSFKDLTGQRFGRLTVLKLDSQKTNGKRSRYYWLCQCDCGNTHIVRTDGLTGGRVKSCGCLHKETAIEHVVKNHKHKLSGTTIYHTWQGMKNRCYNSNNNSYLRYGGRGIKVFEEWVDDFQKFYDYVSQLPHFGENGYSLDRINNNGNYEPNNLRWADSVTQCRNRSSNIIVEYKGEKMTATEAAEKIGIDSKLLLGRIKKQVSDKNIFRVSGKNEKYLVEFDGKIYTFKEIAEITGTTKAAIYQRYRAGKRGKELLKVKSTPS